MGPVQRFVLHAEVKGLLNLHVGNILCGIGGWILIGRGIPWVIPTYWPNVTPINSTFIIEIIDQISNRIALGEVMTWHPMVGAKLSLV